MIVYISREWLVGSGHAKLTVTPYTVVRIHYTERVERLSRRTLTPSICCCSTIEVAQYGRLGLRVSGSVPALLFPTHLFVFLHERLSRNGYGPLAGPWWSRGGPLLAHVEQLVRGPALHGAVSRMGVPVHGQRDRLAGRDARRRQD